MTLESSKTLGGIGAILMFIGVLPYINYFGLLEILGAIMIIAALHDFANIYRERSIFSNAIYGIAIAVLGSVITAVLVFAVLLSNLKDLITQVYPGWNGDWATLPNMTPNATNFDPTTIFPLIGGILVVLVIFWVIAIVSAFFIWRSLKQVSNKSSVGLFGTAGILLLIGAIIPGLGLFLMWISALLLSFAFFAIKPQQQSIPDSISPPPPTTV